MGHCQAYEHDRTTIGSGNSGQQTRNDNQPVAYSMGVDTQILGIAFAQEQGVEGLYSQQSTHKS